MQNGAGFEATSIVERDRAALAFRAMCSHCRMRAIRGACFTVADVERPDPDRKIGFGYVMNEMGSNATLLDPRTTALISAVYASV